MTNFKSEIAEALFDSSVKVSKDALIWAMSNLPDNRNHGSHAASMFNHEKENVFEACGLSEQRCHELSAIMVNHLKQMAYEGTKVSTIVEAVLNETKKTPDLIILLVVKNVQDALDHIQEKSADREGELNKMLKILQMLKKMKGED